MENSQLEGKLQNLAYGHKIAYQWYTRKNNYFQVPYIALNIITILSVFAVLQNADTDLIRYVCLAAVILAHMMRIFQSKFSYGDKATRHKFAHSRLETLLKSRSSTLEIKSVQAICPHLPPYLLYEIISTTSTTKINHRITPNSMIRPTDQFFKHMYEIYSSDLPTTEQTHRGGLVSYVSKTINETTYSGDGDGRGGGDTFTINSQKDALEVDLELLKRVAAVSFAHYLSFIYYRTKYFFINIPATFCNGLAILFNVMRGDDPIVFAIVTALDAFMSVVEERLQYQHLRHYHETATEAYTVLADEIYFRILAQESSLAQIQKSILIFNSIQTSSPTISSHVVKYMNDNNNNSLRFSILDLSLFFRNF
jgi:hypothetical protein